MLYKGANMYMKTGYSWAIIRNLTFQQNSDRRVIGLICNGLLKDQNEANRAINVVQA